MTLDFRIQSQKNERRTSPTLSFRSIVAIAVISVDNIRSLPINAQFGLPAIWFYLVGGLGFFLPILLISSELAILYPTTGGSYLWIKDAFGEKMGSLSIWLQWIVTIIWLPTIFPFLSATFADIFSETLSSNKIYLVIMSLALFWLTNSITMRGVEVTGKVSMICSIFGTLLPMGLMIFLALLWLLFGNQSQIELSFSASLPNSSSFDNLAYFTNILFSLLGLDLVAMHIKEVENPEIDFPKALRLAGVIIITSLTLSTISLCIIVSPEHLTLMDGLMDAFSEFFSAYNMHWMIYFIGISVILGSGGVAQSWMISISRGLHISIVENNIFPWFQAKNENEMPHRILLAQGAIFSLLVTFFIWMPSVNSSYWLFSALTSQFNLMYYVILFAAVIKLRQRRLGRIRSRDVIGPLAGIASSMAGIIVGCIPPPSVSADSSFLVTMISGQIGLVGLIALLWLKGSPNSDKKRELYFELKDMSQLFF